MRKTFLTLLLVLCLVCFAAVTASAEEAHTDHCTCGGTLTGVAATAHEEECAVVTGWTALTQANMVRDGGILVASSKSNDHDMFAEDTGYYYLAEDIELDRALEFLPGDNITICLNGHTLTYKDSPVKKKSVFRISATLNLCDCQGTGVVETDWTGEAPVAYILNGNADATAGAHFNMYGGTLRATDNDYTNKAGILQVGNSGSNPCSFNMYGGTIEGGTGFAGGNIQIERSTATFTMYGGTVRNGSVEATSSTSSDRGGNIYVNQGQLYFYGGTITGGVANKGGDIALADSSTTAAELNGDVGTIDVWTVNTRGLTLGQDFTATKVTVDSQADYGVVVQSGATYETTALFEASVSGERVLQVNGTIRAANPETAAKHTTCYCGGSGSFLHSAVGHSCTLYSDWQDLNAYLAELNPAAGSTVELKTNNARYYLSDDLNVDYYLVFGDATSSTTKAYKLYLDLNGHTLTGASTLTGNCVVRARSQFYLCDSSCEPYAETEEARYSGAIVATANRAYSLMYGSSGARVRIFGGKLYSTYSDTRSGCLIATSCRLDIYSGYVNGGKSSGSGSSLAVYDSGELCMFGGHIEGGETTGTGGGNIYVDKVNGKMSLIGGTISGGKADKGGNIYVNKGSLSISGGTVTGGTASGTNGLGGNIYLHAGSTTKTDATTGIISLSEQYWGRLTMTGGTISDGNATYAGNLYISGTSRTITNGDTKEVYILAATATMSGGTISGGNASYGGSIELRGEMTMSGGTITGGHATNEGGNIRVYLTNVNDADGKNVVISTFTQTGGLITKGTADKTGGNMHAYGNVTLTGGSMTDGYAKSAGGNLRPFRPCVMTIGANYTISGGTCDASGGNIAMGGIDNQNTYSDYCTVTLSGKVLNGSCKENGGNVFCATDFSRLTIDGATITGGSADLNGPDLYLAENGELTLKGSCTIGNLRVTNAANQKVDVSELTVTTPISLTCGKLGKFAEATTDKTGCFVSTQDLQLQYKDGILSTAAPKSLYVSSTGSDSGLGTKTAPFKTFSFAMDAVEDQGTINILDSVEADAFEKHGKQITITGGELILKETRTELQDHIHFKNMTLTIPAGEHYFYCNGFTTVIDEDVTVRYATTAEDGTVSYADTSTNSFIFGGCRGAYQTANGAISGTDLTVLSGTWGYIYGGSNNCDLTGDVHLTVGGTVNKDLDYATAGHDSSTNGYNRVYGGSRASSSTNSANISGTVYMTVTGGKFNSVFGGSRGATTVGNIELHIEGGEGMAAYGAGHGGAQTVGTVNFYFEGGYFEQVFGGCLSQPLTGNVNMYIQGGEIARRLYGGCYNDYGFLSGWSSTYMVTGDIQMFIGEEANISCKLTQHSDRGIHGHGRRANATTSDAENTSIIFLSKAAYDQNSSKLHATDSTMAAILRNVPTADLICYLDWSADDANDVISSNATAVADPETGVTGDASAYNETAALTLSGTSFYYNGKAHEPATVTVSDNWSYGEPELTYADNTEIGTATVTLTANGYTVSATFDIVKKDEVVQIIVGSSATKYEYLQDAVDALGGSGYLQLLMDCNEDMTVSESLYIDLAGHSLTGKVTVEDGAVLYGMDSTTDDYNCTEGYGEITNVTGEVSLQYKTSVTGKVRRYLTYTDPETGAKSFHRIYLGVTSMSLRPAVCGVGYKATFRADHIAQSMLHETEAFGYTLWLDGMDNKLSCAKTRDELDNTKTVTLRIQGMPVDTHGETKVFANVYMKLADNTVITSSDSYFTLRQMLEAINEAFEANPEGYSSTQMNALQSMLEPYAEFLQNAGWTIGSILPQA